MSSITIREAADALDVSIPTIRNWINSGRLKAYKINGNHGLEYRIELEEIARIKGEQPEKTIVIHQEQTDPMFEVPSSWLLGQLSGSIKDIVREVIRDEVEMMRVDIRDEIRQEFVTAEGRIAERDRKLMEVLREIQSIRKQEAESFSWWNRLRGKR